jgi:hypothetical protein
LAASPRVGIQCARLRLTHVELSRPPRELSSKLDAYLWPSFYKTAREILDRHQLACPRLSPSFRKRIMTMLYIPHDLRTSREAIQQSSIDVVALYKTRHSRKWGVGASSFISQFPHCGSWTDALLRGPLPFLENTFSY